MKKETDKASQPSNKQEGEKYTIEKRNIEIQRGFRT